jgi:hypothetical protein
VTGLPPISVIAADLGMKGDKGRYGPSWRESKSQRSVTVDDRIGCWYDHGAGEGGGIVALVGKALGCDRRQAFDWLKQRYGLGKPDPAMLSQRQAVQSTAASLAEWRWGLTQYLRAIRNGGWTDWLEAERMYKGPERIGDLPASTWQALRQRLKLADGIDSYTGRLQGMSAAELIELRDRLEGSC